MQRVEGRGCNEGPGRVEAADQRRGAAVSTALDQESASTKVDEAEHDVVLHTNGVTATHFNRLGGGRDPRS